MISAALTKSLASAQSRDFTFLPLNPKPWTKSGIPNPSPESRRSSRLNNNPNLSLNPNPNEQLKFVHQFAAHWSRDLEKSSFSPITPKGCVFTIRHVGFFRISVEKYVGSYPRNTEISIFTFSTGVWFSTGGSQLARRWLMTSRSCRSSAHAKTYERAARPARPAKSKSFARSILFADRARYKTDIIGLCPRNSEHELTFS